MGFFVFMGIYNIMKIIITEEQYMSLMESNKDSLSATLLKRIEDEGWLDVASLVGGYENLLNIVGKDKIVDLLISCFDDLKIQKRGSQIFLIDKGLPILTKWGSDPLIAYNAYIETVISDKLGSDIIKPYVHVRKELIIGLMTKFPELYANYVDVYKDSGLYQKMGRFYFGEIDS